MRMIYWYFEDTYSYCLYPHTCSTPSISNTFCRKYQGCHCPYCVQTNCLLVKLVHTQQSFYDSPNNGKLLNGSCYICSPQLCSHHSYSFWVSHLSWRYVSRRCMRGTFPLNLFEFKSSDHWWCLDRMRYMWTVQSLPKELNAVLWLQWRFNHQPWCRIIHTTGRLSCCSGENRRATASVCKLRKMVIYPPSVPALSYR